LVLAQRKEFGISIVGLGKICRHRRIPVPPRGYWTVYGHGNARCALWPESARWSDHVRPRRCCMRYRVGTDSFRLPSC